MSFYSLHFNGGWPIMRQTDTCHPMSINGAESRYFELFWQINKITLNFSKWLINCRSSLNTFLARKKSKPHCLNSSLILRCLRSFAASSRGVAKRSWTTLDIWESGYRYLNSCTKCSLMTVWPKLVCYLQFFNLVLYLINDWTNDVIFRQPCIKKSIYAADNKLTFFLVFQVLA